MNGMVDLHTHVLPGLDDGAADLAASVAMCRAAAADGIATLVATPHVRKDYDVSPDVMRSALDHVRAEVGSLVTILPGGEVDIDELNRPLDEILAFSLAGNAAFLLLETPYTRWDRDISHAVERLLAVGITPLLAHPERNRDVQADPRILRPLVEAGSLVQITAASVDGRLGNKPQRCAVELLDRRLAHVLASDAHGPEVRAVGLSRAVAALRDDRLAAWLTVEVPRAIVEGSELPPRPSRTAGPALRRLLRR
jgi:protein-tyrosine phosphatase